MTKKGKSGQDLTVQSLSCGSSHSMALMETGEVYGWGNNEHGQCGTGREPFMHMVQWGPTAVTF